MPTFLPIRPSITTSLDLDRDVHARRQVQLLQLVDRLRRRVDDVEQKKQRLTKAVAGHQEKTGGLVDKKVRILKEFALDEGETVKAGDVLTVSNFEGVQYVDVTGTTKGKGFAGVLKRYKFAGGNLTHGGHSKRRTGGLAARDLPGWIEKGKKMPGHMGDVTRTTTNLEVVQLRPEDNAILVKGSVPGARNGTVFIRKSLLNAALAFKAKKGAK